VTEEARGVQTGKEESAVSRGKGDEEGGSSFGEGTAFSITLLTVPMNYFCQSSRLPFPQK